jgi:hypothetical protein
MADPKSLMAFVCEAIDEALPRGSKVTGRDLYMRGFERYEAAYFERQMKRRRRELEGDMPLLAATESEVIEDFSTERGEE